MSQYHRDIGPVLQIFRAFLRGRGWNEQLRHQERLYKRPYPKPNLPIGPSDRSSDNYYLSRDGRRLVSPPIEIINNMKQISSGEKTSQPKEPLVAPKPGNTYNWD